VIEVSILVPGTGAGEVLALTEPVSFWGGVDAESGRIIDRRHPDHGTRLTGRVVVMTAGRGSSSASSVLAEAIRLGTAPAAIVLRSRDAILATGALVAASLYDRHCPILVAESDAAFARIASASYVEIGPEGVVLR
jgi:predicted aconitase with swiveling domain